MLTTRAPDSEELHSRAMYPTSKKNLTFAYFGNRDSGKFDGIEKDHHTNISFYDTKTTSWVSIAGLANVVDDRQKIKEMFSPMLKSWFADLKVRFWVLSSLCRCLRSEFCLATWL